VARARDIPGFRGEEAFRVAAARVVEVRAAEVFDHSGGVLDPTDIEPLHDMRVATRRLRAALEVFRDCFPRKRLKRALKEVKAIADALGARRDRDVSIEFLGGYLDRVPAADRGRMEILIARLRAEQAEANESLVPFLATQRLEALRAELAQLVSEARE
jgi:CHAD domain-containing protein